jgi:hypothetical protein
MAQQWNGRPPFPALVYCAVLQQYSRGKASRTAVASFSQALPAHISAVCLGVFVAVVCASVMCLSVLCTAHFAVDSSVGVPPPVVGIACAATVTTLVVTNEERNPSLVDSGACAQHSRNARHLKNPALDTAPKQPQRKVDGRPGTLPLSHAVPTNHNAPAAASPVCCHKRPITPSTSSTVYRW